MNLGFIGLGHLGRAIASRLIDCGHALTLYNRTPGKAEGLDATVAASPRDVAEAADVIFLCLFDSTGVDTILDALLAGDISGKCVVDLTTNHFRDVVGFHERCAEAGAEYLEAPVLGSVVPASQGALTLLASGSAETYERLLPLIGQLAQHRFYLGAPGLATKMKLVNNLALGSFMATLAEALSVAERSGIPKGDVLDILAVGGGKSLVLDAKKQKLLDEDFATHFSAALIYKDLHCLQDLAYEQKQPLVTAAAAKELFARTFDAGISGEDFSAVYRLVK